MSDVNRSNVNSYYGEPSRNNKLLHLPETKNDRVKIIIYLLRQFKKITQSRKYVSMLFSYNVKVRFFQRETFCDVKNQNIWDNFCSKRAQIGWKIMAIKLH